MNFLDFCANTICHRLALRTVFINGLKLPLCARCTGIYTGVLTGFLMLALLKRLGAAGFPGIKTTALSSFLLLPLMIDGAGSYLGLIEAINLSRILTGSLFGVFLPMFLVPLINYTENRPKLPEPVISFKEYAVLCAVSVLASLLIYFDLLPFYAAAIISVAGLLVFYILFFSMILRLAFKTLSLSWTLLGSSVITAMYMTFINFILGMIR